MIEFNPKKKEKKISINATIDESLKEMIDKVSEGYDLGFAPALNEILLYFKKTLWDTGEIAKSKEEEEEE